ncbi:hypothetical protein AB0368_27180 [Actinoplanes sp. NPDC051475]|uniref:hypothetical protein n=1 Tax=Actinoplanes sp. NPDC051475 TaxID=3157225 RepID=UPI00344FC004
MTHVLVTGMSGAGKSTLLEELRPLRACRPAQCAPRRSAGPGRDIERYVREVEPLLRNGASVELDGRGPVAELADAVERLLSR